MSQAEIYGHVREKNRLAAVEQECRLLCRASEELQSIVRALLERVEMLTGRIGALEAAICVKRWPGRETKSITGQTTT